MSVSDNVVPREHRLKVFFPAMVSGSGRERFRVHVLDVSAGGARLHTDGRLRTGQAVVLDIFGMKHIARVVWVSGKQIGVSFAVGLSSDEVRAIDHTRLAHLKRAADAIGARLDLKSV